MEGNTFRTSSKIAWGLKKFPEINSEVKGSVEKCRQAMLEVIDNIDSLLGDHVDPTNNMVVIDSDYECREVTDDGYHIVGWYTALIGKHQFSYTAVYDGSIETV